MAIRTERLSPTELKVYDDEFGDDEHLTVSQTSRGGWLVRRQYKRTSTQVGMSTQVGSYSSAEAALDASERVLGEAVDELDAALKRRRGKS